MTRGPTARKRLNVFERYLTLWVALCMLAGVLLGKLLPGLVGVLRGLEFGKNSQINLPIAVLIWLMIYPMMVKIDFTSILGVRRRPKGLLVTLFVNWLVKPFSMALLGWLFFKHLFLPLIGPEAADGCVGDGRRSAGAVPRSNVSAPVQTPRQSSVGALCGSSTVTSQPMMCGWRCSNSAIFRTRSFSAPQAASETSGKGFSSSRSNLTISA